MTEQPRLVFTGNVVADLVLGIDALPEPGGDTIAGTTLVTAGGGLTVMLAAERDGLPVVFAGQYGTGPFGTVVRAALASSGVEIVSAGLDDVDSGFSVVLVDGTAERTFVTSVGAEGRLTRADLDRVPVAPDDLVFVSGYSLAHPANAAALPGWLDGLPAGVRVIVDPSPLADELDGDLLDRVLARTDLLTANARETRILTGTGNLPAAATSLRARIRPTGAVVVRDAANGCWITDQVSAPPVHVPGFAVDAVDSTGAGDTHGGVLAAALSRGDDLAAAARRANAAAAIAVTRRGPATAPTATEIDALLAR
ncbi:PfkB family carbohydrate kinase [Leifsonia poae]|uniref:Sugar kinase n=1 Tax=Leifsonia poae TaxID=110933 RepID=A0A9W6H6R9_9MICO|nr:PfkB family carbohydrate kinase [Leifsonia poae]GLJ74442.1 sugar kinase [Leifsonia poae]